MAVGSRELHRPVLPKQAQCLVSALGLQLAGRPTLPYGLSRYPCFDEMNGPNSWDEMPVVELRYFETELSWMRNLSEHDPNRNSVDYPRTHSTHPGYLGTGLPLKGFHT